MKYSSLYVPIVKNVCVQNTDKDPIRWKDYYSNAETADMNATREYTVSMWIGAHAGAAVAETVKHGVTVRIDRLPQSM